MKTLIVLSVLSAPAFAGGLVLDASRLAAEDARALKAQVAAARRDAPRTFELVSTFAQQADLLDRTKRGGRVAAMGRTFKQMGPEALWPMLELLALTHGDVAQTEGGRRSLAVGLLEAVGELRDERAAPVLRAALDVDVSPLVTRAAAYAYGDLQTDEVAATLVALSKGPGARARAIREGMGSCRRVAVTQALGEALASAHDVREVVELSRTLGDVGNAWAWQTPSVVTRGEEAAVRRLASVALLESFLSRGGEEQQAASNALLVVDATELPQLIGAARAKADNRQLAALTTLESRLANHPGR